MSKELGTPSEFWSRLGADHAAALEREGFEHVKRSQALRYFTWRWRTGRLLASEQLRFLLAHSRPGDWRAALARPLDVSSSAWHGIDWSRGERRAYVIAVRLLWRYAERHGDDAVMALAEPELGDPLPVHLDGRLISQDLANSALEVAAIRRALGTRAPARVIEIGGGYGRSAYALLHRFPEARYTIVDIEPAASISRWYLGQLFPGRVEVIDPESALGLDPASFDLGLSISSLQEMRPDQIRSYLELLDRVAAGGTVYLKQWAEWENPDDHVRIRFSDYPIPAAWRRHFEEPCAVQTRFVHAAWDVPEASDTGRSPA